MWKPISTYPKPKKCWDYDNIVEALFYEDNEIVLGYGLLVDYDEKPTLAFYIKGGDGLECFPTFWHELPKLPKLAKALYE